MTRQDAAELARFFELASDLLAISSFDGWLLTVSPSWTTTLGWSAQELTARPSVDFLHPDDREPTRKAGARVLRGEPGEGFENRYRHRDGSYRWLRWQSVPSLAQRRVYSVVRDVTEERRRQAVAEELEQVTGVGTWELQLDTGRTFWSPVTRALHGLDSAGEKLGDALRFYPPSARRLLEPALDRLVEQGEPFDLELAFIPAHGGDRWVRATGRAQSRAGRVVQVYGTFQDITAAYEEREGLRHFRDLVELSEEGILELDATGTITYANHRMATMLGMDPGGLHGRPAAELLADDEAAALAPWGEGPQVDGNAPIRAEHALRHRNGTSVWVQVAARVHRTPDGALDRVSAVVSDVSAHKRRHTELEDTRRHLEEAQRLARLGHWWDALDAGRLTWSPMVYEIFGVDPAEFTPTREAVRALIHPDDLDHLRASRQAGQNSGHHEVTYRIRRPDGEVHVVHELARVETDASGATVLTGTVQDITALKQAELALRESEDRLQRVLAATNDGWWDHDLRTDTTFHSERFYAIHGYTRQEVEESPTLWRTLTHPDDLAAMDEVVARTMAAREPMFTVTGRIRHQQGHLVPIVGRGFIEYDEHGRAVRMSGSTTDVTDLRHAETAKEEFVSTVSHELRTPLTSIGGALELLEAGVTGTLEAPAAQLVAVARRNTARLRLLIDDLLDMEQLLTGRMTFALEVQPLSPLLEQALADTTPYAESHDVTLAFTRRDDPVHVEVDRSRLQQVLANLLSNAVKYAPEASRVELRMDARDGWVRTEVIDRGPGVPESFSSRLFQRFEQADPSDPRSRGGTGLGLAITRQIVERLGGEVGYDSRPGRTSFWFDLPVRG